MASRERSEQHVNLANRGARGQRPIKYKSRSYFENCPPNRYAARRPEPITGGT